MEDCKKSNEVCIINWSPIGMHQGHTRDIAFTLHHYLCGERGLYKSMVAQQVNFFQISVQAMLFKGPLHSLYQQNLQYTIIRSTSSMGMEWDHL